MVHFVEAGTDAASLLLFDPETLPDEFDAALASGVPITILDRMHDEGRLICINSGCDGGFLLHAFVDEEIPEMLIPFLRDPKTANSFRVLGNAVFFAGAEYGYHKDNSAILKYPHMGGSFAVENGTYQATLYRTEYPDNHLQVAFEKLVTPAQRRICSIFNGLAAFAGLAVIVFVVSFAFLPLRIWLVIGLPITLLCVTGPIGFSRLPAYRRVNALWNQLERQYPSIVAVFRRCDCEEINN